MPDVMLQSVPAPDSASSRQPLRLRVLSAIILLLAVVCLAVGSFIGLLWATSHPERAPHGGLLLGLPAGFLFFEGVLLVMGGLWIEKRWRGFAVGGPLLGMVLPLVAMVNHHAIWVGSFLGLAPFALLAWVIKSLS